MKAVNTEAQHERAPLPFTSSIANPSYSHGAGSSGLTSGGLTGAVMGAMKAVNYEAQREEQTMSRAAGKC